MLEVANRLRLGALMNTLVGNGAGHSRAVDTPPGASTVSGEKLSTGVPGNPYQGGASSPSPSPVAEPARLCACNCGESLADLRADAKYHSEACKKRAERARRRDKAGTRRRSRRRTDRGTRIYLVSKELQAVARDLTPTSPESERFLEKVRAARERLEARAA